jgi:hypothetical protein
MPTSGEVSIVLALQGLFAVVMALFGFILKNIHDSVKEANSDIKILTKILLGDCVQKPECVKITNDQWVEINKNREALNRLEIRVARHLGNDDDTGDRRPRE